MDSLSPFVNLLIFSIYRFMSLLKLLISQTVPVNHILYVIFLVLNFMLGFIFIDMILNFDRLLLGWFNLLFFGFIRLTFFILFLNFIVILLNWIFIIIKNLRWFDKVECVLVFLLRKGFLKLLFKLSLSLLLSWFV